MIILTENISWVTEHVQNLCIFTQISIFFCYHGNLHLDVDQILMTTANTEENNPCQFAKWQALVLKWQLTN